MQHPYKSLPDHCFWSRSHRTQTVNEIDPVVRGGFKIGRDTRIATAGSCFAQNLARVLQADGYAYLVTEKPHPIVREDAAKALQYGTFSARYGNIYTARQLRQLAERVTGRFTPKEEPWRTEDGRFIDPFRPTIQPGGFLSEASFQLAREQHFEAVRDVFRLADVFIFTFGLTEGWRSKADGAAFPICPGVSGGTFDPDRYEFFNQTVDEVVADFQAFAKIVAEFNPKVRYLITVSPVPLAATAMDRSVITSTTYSKSVLRVACEMLAASSEQIAYFPSYEVITLSASKGAYYQQDLRNVTEQGIDHVMELFLRHYTDGSSKPVKPSAPIDSDYEALNADLQTICDEEVLDLPVAERG